MSTVFFDASKRLGAIKPVNGIDNGPLSSGGGYNMSEQYKDLEVPYVRLHDTDYPFPQQVDIPQIFRDFGADPYDPDSYDFILTDQYLAAIVDAGAQIIYRLGTSIEHVKEKRYIYPPKDYEKWAVVCEHIIAHYNEGWANGFHYGIKYWEIWNEPEDYNGKRRLMWLGKPEEYYRLYDVASKHLKARFGDAIRVGGYACTNLRGFEENATNYYRYLLGYYHDFLTYIKEHESPLDFFSFHNYSDDYRLTLRCADYARRTLNEAGFEKAEMILDEWNSDFGSVEQYTKMTTMWGAIYVASTMIGLQHSPVDIATYYDGQPCMPFCGLFGRDRRLLKPYYAFRMFRRLRALGTEVEVTCEGEAITAMAASNGNHHGMMILNEGEEVELSLTVAKSTPKTMRLYLLDEQADDLLLAEGVFSKLRLPRRSIVYLDMED